MFKSPPQPPADHQPLQVCLAALAAAEPEAEAWYGPYGYSNWGYNWMNGNNMMNNMYWGRPGYSQGYRQMNYMNGHEGHRFQSFHKREAEAEPEAKAEAFYGPYSYSNWGNNWPMGYNMYNNMWNQQWNRPSFTQYRTFYHKRSAEAEPEADAWYQPYGYSYNWNMMNNNNMMNYWNMPYMNNMPYNMNNMMYNYRYQF